MTRWSASDLARESGVSLSTIHRAEAVDGETAMTFANAAAVRKAFENAGVEMIEEHSAGPGARLKRPLLEHEAPKTAVRRKHSYNLPFLPRRCRDRPKPWALGWSQQDLAKHARVGVVTVHPLEAAISQPRRATLDVIQRAFEAAGVEFTDGDQPGVRLTAAAARQLIAAHKGQPNIEKKRRSAKRGEKRQY